MSTSISIAPHPKTELGQMSTARHLRSFQKESSRNAGVRGQSEGLIRRFGAFLCECRRRMMIMQIEYEHSGDGTRSRERSEERLRDEEAWSRMDDEGCPNGSQVDSRIRRRSAAASDTQLCHL